MESYRTLLLNRAGVQIDALLQSNPPAGSELEQIKQWLGGGFEPGGDLVTDATSTAPDIVIGWIGNLMFNPDGPEAGTFAAIGQEIRGALNATEWPGGEKGAAVIMGRLANGLFNVSAAAATNPQAGPFIEQALDEQMNDLPSLPAANDFGVAWVSQATMVMKATPLATAPQTKQLGIDIKEALAKDSPLCEVPDQKTESVYSSEHKAR